MSAKSGFQKPLPPLPQARAQEHIMQKQENECARTDKKIRSNILLRAKRSLMNIRPGADSEPKRLPYTPIKTQDEADPHNKGIADRNLDRERLFPPRSSSTAYVAPTKPVDSSFQPGPPPATPRHIGRIQPLIPSDDPYSYHVAVWNKLQADWGLHGRKGA